MNFDLDRRTAALGVGEFAGFSLGPREAGSGAGSGLWRAQLGQHWHQELRRQATATDGSAEFERPIEGGIVHRGWTLTLSGRVDQLVPSAHGLLLREIKSILRPLPADEAELRAEYPAHFIQLAAYAALARIAPEGAASPRPARFELVFVEADSGLAQTVALTPADDGLFRAQLERLTEFLDLRLRARERLRRLRFRPAFAQPRPGQETTRADLTSQFERRPLVLFEAPTGFGKTGVLLEFALGQLQSGHFDRALYLTSKSTGQLQVVHTLAGMTGTGPAATPPDPAGDSVVATWHVRNKAEHCVNTTFHCVRESCSYLADAALRWPASGLARFYLDERQPRDLDTLRAAGRDARICPYEITRGALPFNDLWIGDYNYVFAPRNRSLFLEQPGFFAARTLLVLDEAHNLPARVADAHSQSFTALEAHAVHAELQRLRAPSALQQAWGHWCHFLQHLAARDALSAADEDDARHLIDEVAQRVRTATLDLAQLGPQAADALWSLPAWSDQLAATSLPRLWWCPRDTELAITCLDAAPAIAASLREFGGVVLASATLTPVDGFAAACGLDASLDVPAPAAPAAPSRLGSLNQRDTRRLFRHLTSGSALLQVEEARDAAAPVLVRAHTPWRDGSYTVGYDGRVDTSFQHRALHHTTTADTVARLHGAARSHVAVFFPSYAYAEAIQTELAATHPELRVAVQPRLRDLTGQAAWVEEALRSSDTLFLIVGSSFAEGIDSLGGRISHAMVVGPALPEVNAIQRARLAEATARGLGREAAFRQVYQLPGMTKVNQALGRLVRAPGQRTRVLLHCRRFLDPAYASLLAPAYQGGQPIPDLPSLEGWLAG
jgi:Rad3-related DNA helicase